jgi:hypothetical protein
VTLYGSRVSLHGSMVSLHGFMVSLHDSMVSLHDSMTFVIFTEAWTNQEEVLNKKKFGAGTYVPFRKGQNVPEKKTFLFVPLKKI